MTQNVHSRSGDARASRQRMEKLAWVLDGAIPVPGTKFRFGLDSIIGLIPGIGDVLGLLLGAAILYEGLRIGAPRPLMWKMVGNSVADAVLGLVPVLGDLFDFAFKSNKRNVRLLMEHIDRLDAPRATPDRTANGLALLLLVTVVAGFAGLVWLAWSRLLA